MNILKRAVIKMSDILHLLIYRIIWWVFYGNRAKIGSHCRIKGRCSLNMDINGNMTIGNGFLCRSYIFILVESGNLSIGNNVFLNHNVSITCLNKIEIGDNCKIANNVVIVDHDHDFTNRELFVKAPVRIESNVWIGSNVTITKGVTIGENSIIAAGSIVTRDIPSNCVAAGVPAKVIKYLW